VIGTGDVVGRLEERVRELEQENLSLIARAERAEERLELARRTAWVSAPVPWRLVMVGDTIVSKTGHLLKVVDADKDGPVWRLRVQGEDRDSWPIQTRDPDKPVPVLRRPTHDALKILADQLGARPA
jgi:hypothetical protein